MIEQKALAYKDMKVFYWTAGNSERQAVVFLHPAFGDHTMFKHQISHFKKDYYVIAVDMVAHGKSQPCKDRVDMRDMPDIIANILDGCGVEKAHLVGVSLGSLVVQAVAHAHPDRAASVTIVGGYSIHKDNKHILRTQRKAILRWGFYMLTSMKKFKAHVVNTTMYSEEGRTISTQAITSFTRRSFMYMGGMDRFFVDNDAPVSYPLLIICGEHDTPLALDAAQRLNVLEPGSKLAVIKDAGHCANIDNPISFNAVLDTFLTEAGV